ncbi:TIGR04255 family protein [Chamaesiphon polymorphus]|uniref:TIGR04255 family protein n=1 Tax=Chamaesiphon polymorphus CCALA 037 TaxID=2107692 RepID=A0A2T1G2J4_9CYAN|nr:TIGR04255 family protein [Chamaesiphon polymorphus CCALA 037]
MHLPDFERVIYERNPLIQVACQLRFPPILKISHHEPVEFQDRVRSHYPLFETTSTQVPPEISQFIQQIGAPLRSEVSYNFKSEDMQWQLSIGRDFISLTTSHYKSYEDFKPKFKEAVDVFEEIYNPSFYTRLGLFYQDLIFRSKLGLKDKSWSELITEQIASELYNQDFEDSIESLTKNLILQAEFGKINLQHGLVNVKEAQKDIEETCYLLNADFYTEKRIERDGSTWNILNEFNRSARNLFRWSITDTLHNAMRPRNVEISVT